MSTRVSTILTRKGSDVATIGTAAPLTTAAQQLAEHNVGALVVSEDQVSVIGILSERDLVREIARSGLVHWARRPVRDVMTTDVMTCAPEDTIDGLMSLMTNQRIRHVPVLADGKLSGMISIGDIVKMRLDELEVQAQALEQYVAGA